MTDQMPTEKVIDRIKKLLALADKNRNSSAAEAESAAAKVQELLQDYNLSLEQVTASERAGDAVTDREKAETDRRAMYKWQRDLMAALARGNFCIHFTIEKLVERTLKSRRHLGLKKSTFHVLIGRTMNIHGTVALYDYLVKAIGREAVKAGFDHGTSDNAVFFDGAVSRLAERLAAQRFQRMKEEADKKAAAKAATSGAPGTGLVLLSEVYGSEDDLNSDLLYGLPAGTTANRRLEREGAEKARQLVAIKLQEQGVDWVEAFYRSHGYSIEDAKKAAKEYYKKNSRSSSSRSKAEKRKGEAFYAGREAADGIGLDLQVERNGK